MRTVDGRTAKCDWKRLRLWLRRNSRDLHFELGETSLEAHPLDKAIFR